MWQSNLMAARVIPLISVLLFFSVLSSLCTYFVFLLLPDSSLGNSHAFNRK